MGSQVLINCNRNCLSVSGVLCVLHCVGACRRVSMCVDVCRRVSTCVDACSMVLHLVCCTVLVRLIQQEGMCK